MGQLTLADVYQKHGHVYVTNQGYVSIHFYVKDSCVADSVCREVNARVLTHGQILDVVISRKDDLAKCARILLHLKDSPLNEAHKYELVLVSKYVGSTSKRERLDVCTKLRELASSRRGPSIRELDTDDGSVH